MTSNEILLLSKLVACNCSSEQISKIKRFEHVLEKLRLYEFKEVSFFQKLKNKFNKIKLDGKDIIENIDNLDNIKFPSYDLYELACQYEAAYLFEELSKLDKKVFESNLIFEIISKENFDFAFQELILKGNRNAVFYTFLGRINKDFIDFLISERYGSSYYFGENFYE